MEMENSTLFYNCELALSFSSFCIHAPNKDTASRLRRSLRLMAMQALKFKKEDTQIFYPGCKRPFQIPARMALGAMALSDIPASSNNQPSRDRHHDLLGADYMRILEFLMEQRQEGNIVIVTSNTTNICYHTNDLLLPSRATWTANKFTGYNYLRSWRASRQDNPLAPERLNPQFDTMRELLNRDGYIRDYEYTLYRPDDALCSYQTDYYLCRDYCGDEVRIGVSRPQDWQLIESAEAIRS